MRMTSLTPTIFGALGLIALYGIVACVLTISQVRDLRSAEAAARRSAVHTSLIAELMHAAADLREAVGSERPDDAAEPFKRVIRLRAEFLASQNALYGKAARDGGAIAAGDHPQAASDRLIALVDATLREIGTSRTPSDGALDAAAEHLIAIDDRLRHAMQRRAAEAGVALPRMMVLTGACGLVLLACIAVFGVAPALRRQRGEIDRLLAQLARDRHDATHDERTGMPNRLALQEILEGWIAADAEEAARHPEGRAPAPPAALHLALDHSRLPGGMAAADRADPLVRTAARRLTELLPAEATAGRVGAGEFVVLLRRTRGAAAVQDAAEAIVEGMSAALAEQGQLLRLPCVIGAARAEPSRPLHPAADAPPVAPLRLPRPASAWRRASRVLPLRPAALMRRDDPTAAFAGAAEGEDFGPAEAPPGAAGLPGPAAAAPAPPRARGPRADEAEALLAQAEAALASALRAGRRRTQLWNVTLRRDDARSAELTRSLSHAIAERRIVPFFQPQASLANGRLVGFESLVRWRHPVRGLLSPASFVPLAEESGQIEALGDATMRASLAALAAWRASGLHVHHVAINVSARELRDPALADKLAWDVDAAGLSPANVAVEILESVLVEDDEDPAIRTVARLAAAGFSVELDDFGSGHASIANLRKLRVHRIKIDRGFVTGLDRDPDKRKIVRGIVGLAASLDIETLAEGVETLEEAAVARDLGCALAQGYLLGRPMPAEAAETWVREWSGPGFMAAMPAPGPDAAGPSAPAPLHPARGPDYTAARMA